MTDSDIEYNILMNRLQVNMLRNIDGQVDLRPYVESETKWITKRSYSNSGGLFGESDDKDIYTIKLSNGELVLVKVNNSDDTEYSDFNESINEIFVGLFGINKLNSPNFAKIINFTLDSECLDSDSAHSKTCNYVAYQYIQGQTLGKLIIDAKVSREILIKIIKEIFHVLHHAYHELKFVHNDLHLDNIMITNEFIPVIIDYGRSTIQLDGKDYGMRDSSICVSALQWQHDTIYFLCHLIAILCPPEITLKHASKSKILSDVIYGIYMNGDIIESRLRKLRENINNPSINIEQELDKIIEINRQISVNLFNISRSPLDKLDILMKNQTPFNRKFSKNPIVYPYKHMEFLFDLLNFFPNAEYILDNYINEFYGDSSMISKDMSCDHEEFGFIANFDDFIQLVDDVVK